MASDGDDTLSPFHGGTVTIYSELQRILQHYWKTHGNLAHLEKLAWDIYPLGWEPGSDSIVYFRVWAFDKKERKFLGIWKYDGDAQRTELVNLKDDRPEPAQPDEPPKPTKSRRRGGSRRSREKRQACAPSVRVRFRAS